MQMFEELHNLERMTPDDIYNKCENRTDIELLADFYHNFIFAGENALLGYNKIKTHGIFKVDYNTVKRLNKLSIDIPDFIIKKDQFIFAFTKEKREEEILER